jgi:hypothetical protein
MLKIFDPAPLQNGPEPSKIAREAGPGATVKEEERTKTDREGTETLNTQFWAACMNRI